MDWVVLGGITVVLALVALVPFPYMDWPQGRAGIALRTFPAGAVAILSVIVLAQGRLAVWRRDPLIGPLVAVCAMDVISSISGLSPEFSLAKAAYYGLTGPLFYLIVRSSLGASLQARRILMGTIAATAAVAAAYGISEFASGSNWLYSRYFESNNPAYSSLIGGTSFGRRVLGTSGHPVIFGAYLLICLPVCLSLIRWGGSIRWWGVTAALTIGSGILFTFSRGAWLGMAVAWLVLAILRPRRALLWGLVPLLAATAILVTSDQLSQLMRSRNPYTQYVGNFGENARVKAYSYTAEVLSRNLFFGGGIGTYRHQARPLGSRLDTPDNYYLARLADTGVAGLASWLALMCVAGRVLLANRGTGTRSESSVLLLSGFAGFAFVMLTFDALYVPVIRMIFWAVLAIAISDSTQTDEGA